LEKRGGTDLSVGVYVKKLPFVRAGAGRENLLTKKKLISINKRRVCGPDETEKGSDPGGLRKKKLEKKGMNRLDPRM